MRKLIGIILFSVSICFGYIYLAYVSRPTYSNTEKGNQSEDYSKNTNRDETLLVPEIHLNNGVSQDSIKKDIWIKIFFHREIDSLILTCTTHDKKSFLEFKNPRNKKTSMNEYMKYRKEDDTFVYLKSKVSTVINVELK